MSKKSTPARYSEGVQSYLHDVGMLCDLPVAKKYEKLWLREFPFDLQLLSASRLYRVSRASYLSVGGTFGQKICSTMRSLSAQDLFKDEIDFTPSMSEIVWFKDHIREVSGPEEELAALGRFNEISLYHEQNHRVLWRLLPPAPQEERDLCRYLNFAESLVVTLDLALGDELGKKYSSVFERMKVIYRPGGEDKWFGQTKQFYRQYLLALLSTTYFALELINPEDILNAVDFVLPGQKKMNKDAVRRGLELSELFSRVTNPMWQERFWQVAGAKLKKMHKGNAEDPLYLPEDPLDLEDEFALAFRVFSHYGL